MRAEKTHDQLREDNLQKGGLTQTVRATNAKIDIATLSTEELTILIMRISEVLEERRQQEKTKPTTVYDRKYPESKSSHSILKPATLPDLGNQSKPKTGSQQPPPKRQKLPTTQNYYKNLSIDEPKIPPKWTPQTFPVFLKT